jgi:hypothetical protein
MGPRCAGRERVASRRRLRLPKADCEGLDDFLTASGLEQYLVPEDENGTWYEERGVEPLFLDAEEHRERLEGAGLGAERIAVLVQRCRDIVARPEWAQLAEDALASEDYATRANGIAAAKRLGIPMRAYLIAQIERNPNDGPLWYELVYRAPHDEVRDAVKLAERVWDLDALASGPALDLFGPMGGEGPHQAVEYVLQELPRCPGAGQLLLQAILQSPVIRHRLTAVRVLARWPKPLPHPVRATIEGMSTDPDKGVRRHARVLLEGRPLTEA